MNDFQAAVAVTAFIDVDLGADALLEGINVGDDADGAIGHAQVFEGC